VGKPAESSAAFDQAVRLAQPENIRLPFLEVRDHLLELVEAARKESYHSWLLDALQPGSRSVELPPLTRREKEILKLLTQGLTNREMADQLVIAEGTLKRHVANLYHKLGVHTRAQAIRFFR
jgi:ATP/maltotriose-dependent transcriptional regulator MalT